ncbi:MAG: ORF6N domain-containing protein [Desulfobacteraceae bacterium]|nr:ORF6N domain-containing protein [Desulfobacteraceae bacterium]MDH3723809.1 ORF6N domain-containing protein [Desulfobacteraceae bacterium]
MTTLIPIELIASKIYFIRNMKVMLDRDLAELYEVETKALKQAVRRNIDRFPADFMFELTKDEYQSLRSQIVTLKRGQHSKYAPFAFTEHGVLMLSSVLNSERAIQVNIQIVRTFTKLREMLSTHKDLKRKIESMEKKYDEQFQIVFEAIKQLLSEEDKPKKKIGYTVKEKQKAYGKSVKKKKPSTDGSFTPKAKKIWEAIPGIIQFKILNNVWCVQCRKESSIGNLSGKIESGMLVLRGTCTTCGGDVARVIENE